MSALVMMLRSMGIDPEEMIRRVDRAQNEAREIVGKLEARLIRIEEKLDSLITQTEKTDGQ